MSYFRRFLRLGGLPLSYVLERRYTDGGVVDVAVEECARAGATRWNSRTRFERGIVA